MSVELSSWDTWNRGDNATNNHIDYYNKGQLVGPFSISRFDIAPPTSAL